VESMFDQVPDIPFEIMEIAEGRTAETKIPFYMRCLIEGDEAGYGNRTRLTCLGSKRIATMLIPPVACGFNCSSVFSACQQETRLTCPKMKTVLIESLPPLPRFTLALSRKLAGEGIAKRQLALPGLKSVLRGLRPRVPPGHLRCLSFLYPLSFTQTSSSKERFPSPLAGEGWRDPEGERRGEG
jgi:hypothetical protein